MNVLLLGGTSFFGKSILKQFTNNGDQITVFTRGNRKPTDATPHRHIIGDRKNKKDLQKAAGSWDLVIDNIGYDRKDLEIALEVFGNAKRFLFTSTVSVYRYAPQGLTTPPLMENSVDYESTPEVEDLNDVHWKYAFGKKEAEKVLISQSTTPWTIFRPTLVYGPFDITERGFWYVLRLIKGGPILLPDGGNDKFRLAYSEDLAKCYVVASQEPKTIGKVYNIAQNEIISLRSFLESSMKALGVKRELVSVPAETLESIDGPFDRLRNVIPDIQAARQDFGFVPQPLEQCIHDTAIWFRDHWQGDEAKLLATREREITVARS